MPIDRLSPAVLSQLAVCCAWLMSAWVAAAETTTSPRLPDSSVTVDRIDNASKKRLVQADDLLEDGQLAAAVENVVLMMDSSGDRLIRVQGSSITEQLGFLHYITVRQSGHQWLAGLARRAPAALELYRDRVDSLAARWVRDGRRSWDESLLQRVADEMFVSRSGDDALFWLGELARQRGDYTVARSYWERIHPELRYLDGEGRHAFAWWLLEDGERSISPPAKMAAATSGHSNAATSWLAYPDSDRDLPEMRMRLVLVSVLEGDKDRARAELRWLESTSPLSKGVIAGRRGQCLELLSEMMDVSPSWQPDPPPTDWTTFGGSSQRWKPSPRALDLGGRPIWRQPLPQLTFDPHEEVDRQLRVAEDAAGLLSIYPVVAEGLVAYAVGLQVTDIEAVSLRTGQVVFPRERMVMDQEVPHRPGTSTVPRITLTTSGSTLFALALDRRALPGRIAAVDLKAQRRLQYVIELGRPHWQGTWIFEGAPVADDAALYASVRRVDQARHECHLACFDVRNGALLWTRLVCRAETEAGMEAGYVANVLTLDEGTLFYNTNLGVVSAFRAADGFPIWALKYPRLDTLDPQADPNDLHRFRDLTPCLVHHDTIVVAPRDCEHIFALDAITGSLLWVTRPGWASDVTHLLGVAGGQLLASGECLYWIDLRTGRALCRFPSSFHTAASHARPSPRGYGRGLLAGELVYWPTRDAIYVFHQQTSTTEGGWGAYMVKRIDLASRGATGGHLMLQDGILLIASGSQLYAFNETGMRRPNVGN